MVSLFRELSRKPSWDTRRYPLPASLEWSHHPDSHLYFGSPSASFPPLHSTVIADNADFNIFTLAELFAFRCNYEARPRLLRGVVEWGEDMPILLGGRGLWEMWSRLG